MRFSATTGFDLFDDEIINEQRPNANMQASDFIVDIREYDVPYHVRVSIDKGIIWIFASEPSRRLRFHRYSDRQMV